MASVTLRGLAKTYDPGGTQAVADLSLDVRDGEFFVLLGPSGCGKTTVLRCIAGLDTPSAGEIRIGDRDVTPLSPGERDVAMVFQSHALYPHLSVWGNIAFGLELHRALGVTVVYVTHDQVEAMTMGQRIAVLAAGRLRQLGSPAEVYGQPADVFVARFLGNPGMNVLTGRGRGAGRGGGVVDCGAWSIAVPLEHYEGEIHLGVRPEHVRLCAPDQGTAMAEIRVVEPLGADTLIHLDAGGQRVIARVAGFPDFRSGDRVGVTLDRQHLHLFDAGGARLG